MPSSGSTIHCLYSTLAVAAVRRESWGAPRRVWRNLNITVSSHRGYATHASTSVPPTSKMSGYADPYVQDGHNTTMNPDSTYPPARPGSKYAHGDSFSTYSDKPRVSLSEADNRRSALPKTAPRGSRYFTGERGNAERPMSQWTVGIEPPPKGTGMLRMWRKENRAGWVEVCRRWQWCGRLC
jgi:hypothetical protein